MLLHLQNLKIPIDMCAVVNGDGGGSDGNTKSTGGNGGGGSGGSQRPSNDDEGSPNLLW